MQTNWTCGVIAAVVGGGFSALPALGFQCDEPMDIVIADLTGDQVQVKADYNDDGLVDASDFVVWRDNSAGGYDIRLQLIDAQGQQQFDPNGMLVADLSFSSTQDYGLDVDGEGFALLAFRDDRFGGTKITAQRIGSDGSLPWGNEGVQFTDGSAFVASPKITATSNGDCVVAWTHEKDVHLQRIDAEGNVLWGSDTVLTNANGESLSLADIHASVDGDVIVSWVQSLNFNSPKHLYAQRIDVDGETVWGENLAVFDGGSLQFGNFPPFVEDGNGGGVFAWYNTSGSLQCYVQHVNKDGTEVFAHNGVAVSTNGNQSRVSPSAAYDAANDQVYVFWTEQNTGQSQRGVYGQRIDGNGTRQWTDNGLVVRPVSAGVDYRSINTLFADAKATVCFVESAGFGDDRIRAAGVTGAGTLRWNPDIVSVTPGGEERSRLVASPIGISNSALLVWQQGGTGESDIHAQRIRTNTGTLGTVPIDLLITGNCPGTLSLRAFDCTPGGRVAFVYARNAGNFAIPGNFPCSGTRLCVNSTVKLARNVVADRSGIASMSTAVPNAACGGRILIQAIDVATCSTSRAVGTP